MKQVLIVLLLVFLVGCLQPIGCPEDARLCEDGTMVVRVPPDCEFEACPVIPPTATPVPTTIPTSEPTPLPQEHACFVVTDESLANAISIQECFFEREEYVECTYFMLKNAREAETTQGITASWPMKLYSKSIDCAKNAEESPNADLLPNQLSIKIIEYFEWLHSDANPLVSKEQIDELVVELNNVRNEFV